MESKLSFEYTWNSVEKLQELIHEYKFQATKPLLNLSTSSVILWSGASINQFAQLVDI